VIVAEDMKQSMNDQSPDFLVETSVTLSGLARGGFDTDHNVSEQFSAMADSLSLQQ
jgi:hypothetical protein